MRRLLFVCLTVTLHAHASDYKKPKTSELLVAGGLAAAAAAVTYLKFEGMQAGALVTAATVLGTAQLSEDVAYRFSRNKSAAGYAALTGAIVVGAGLWQDKVPLWPQAALTTYFVVRAVQVTKR